jgi:hypothetical protein
VSNLKIGWLTTGVLGVTVVVLVALIYVRYRRDIRAARERVVRIDNSKRGAEK